MSVYVPSPTLPGDRFFTVTTNEDKLGLKFHNVEVTTVVDGCWADKEGIEVDDEIVEVNGTDFGGVDPSEQLKLLKQPRPLTIKFKRPIVKDSYYKVTLDAEKVGMGFKSNRVSTVTPKGWAEKVGVMPNDEIVEVNGTGFSQLKEAEKVALFKQPRPINLKLKRPAATIKAIIESGKEPKLPGEAIVRIPKALLMAKKEVAPVTEVVEEFVDKMNSPPPIIETRSVAQAPGWFSCCAAGVPTGESTTLDPVKY